MHRTSVGIMEKVLINVTWYRYPKPGEPPMAGEGPFSPNKNPLLYLLPEKFSSPFSEPRQMINELKIAPTHTKLFLFLPMGGVSSDAVASWPHVFHHVTFHHPRERTSLLANCGIRPMAVERVIDERRGGRWPWYRYTNQASARFEYNSWGIIASGEGETEWGNLECLQAAISSVADDNACRSEKGERWERRMICYIFHHIVPPKHTFQTGLHAWGDLFMFSPFSSVPNPYKNTGESISICQISIIAQWRSATRWSTWQGHTEFGVRLRGISGSREPG